MDQLGQLPESLSGLRIGKYKVVRRLAVGGMGEVFLARHEGPAGFSKTLVVKRILAHLASEPQFVEMFLNEARLAAMVSHPNVVQIFELGEDEGSYFMAMEYIQGRSVRAIETKLQRRGRVFDPPLAAYLAAQALQGLHHAHEMRDEKGEPFQIVHRDVSPDNILIGYGGVVKLLDFGIAKAIAAAGNQTGTLRGKFAYMSFEQLTGSPLDRRADIYSMGSVLYEMVTGQLPYVGAHPAFIASMMRSPPVAPSMHNPRVPLELDSILFKALAMEADKRFQTAQEMGDALMEFASRREKVTSIQVDAFLRKAFDEDSAPEEMIADKAGTQVVSPGTGQGITAPGTGVDDKVAANDGLRESVTINPDADAEPKTLAPLPVTASAPSEVPTHLRDLSALRVQRATTAEQMRAIRHRVPRTGVLGRRQLKGIAAALAVVLVILIPIIVARLFRNRYVAPRPVRVAMQSAPLPAPESEKPRQRAPRRVTPAAIVVDMNGPDAQEPAAGRPRELPASVGRSGEAETEQPPVRSRESEVPAARTSESETKQPPVRASDPDPASSQGSESVPKPGAARSREPGSAPAKSVAMRPRDAESAVPKATTRTRDSEPVTPKPSPSRPGAVMVRVHPWAEVLVAGKNLGTTPLPALSLPAGRHVIVLRNPELGVEKSVTVTVPSGGEASVNVNLMQNSPAASRR